MAIGDAIGIDLLATGTGAVVGIAEAGRVGESMGVV